MYSNWLDAQIESNENYKEKIVPIIENLTIKYPEEALTFKPILKRLNQGSFTEDYLLEVRNILRGIISKKEQQLLKEKDEIWKATKAIYDINNSINVNPLLVYETKDCFSEGFDFKVGKNFYYLLLPKLNLKIDNGMALKSENMLDKYIRNSLIDSIQKYQIGRDKLEVYSSYAIVFIHHFKEENKEIYDTDNIEIKKPIDGVNGLLIENDTVQRSHIYQITMPSENEYTEMYIIKGHNLSDAILKTLEPLK